VEAIKQTAPGELILIDSGKFLNVKVALIGLHVVGVVKNHPEFIWATFEHKENTPDLPPNPNPTKIASNKNWTFYAKNTVLGQCAPALQFDGTKLTLNAEAQKISPVTNVYRAHPWGGPTDQKLVQDLNDSVHEKLGDDSIWGNYNLIGSVWLLSGSLKPDINPVNLGVGSEHLENTTMESFTQSSSKNCFNCHTTKKQTATPEPDAFFIPPTNLNVSHALMLELLQQGQQAAGN